MTLSLDSSVVVDLLRGKEVDVRRRFNAARSSGEMMVICSAAFAELVYGAHKAEAREVSLRNLEVFTQSLQIVPFEAEDALVAGRLRAEGVLSKQPIGTADLFIAAQALNRSWTVVTSDMRHFPRVQGLSVLNWRVSNKPFDIAELIAGLTGRNEE